MLNSEQILARARQLPRMEKVPFLGDQVLVKAISAAELDQWEWENVQQRRDSKGVIRNLRARLCVLAIVDEAGERLFKDDQAEQLSKLEGADLDPVYEVACRLGGISKREREAIEKNLLSGPGAASPSV